MKKNVIDTTHIGVGHMENDTITKQMVEEEATYIQGKMQEHGTESKALQEESGVGYYKRHHRIKGERET